MTTEPNPNCKCNCHKQKADIESSSVELKVKPEIAEISRIAVISDCARNYESCNITVKDIQIQDEVTSYEADIHSTPDAKIWAKYFMEIKGKNNWKIEDIDEELMLGWFANAMMAMHDHIYQTKTVTEKE